MRSGPGGSIAKRGCVQASPPSPLETTTKSFSSPSVVSPVCQAAQRRPFGEIVSEGADWKQRLVSASRAGTGRSTGKGFIASVSKLSAPHAAPTERRTIPSVIGLFMEVSFSVKEKTSSVYKNGSARTTDYCASYDSPWTGQTNLW